MHPQRGPKARPRSVWLEFVPSCLFAAALGAAALGAANLAAATRWEMPSEYPASAMPGEGLALFARLVAERSSGRLEIDPKPDERRLTSAKIVEEVAAGRLGAGDAFAGVLGKLDPIFDLSSLPFVTSGFAEARRLAELARTAYRAALAGRGLHLAYLVPWPASGVWSKRPLTTPDDISHLAIRTYDTTSSRVFAAAGARAEPISFGEVARRLQDGSLDAVLSSGDGGAGRRLWETLPCFTAIDYAFPLSFGFVNADAYAALADADQAALDAASSETEAALWRLVETRLAANYALMRTNGVAIAPDPPQSVRDTLARAAASAITEWRSRTPSGAAILDAFGPH